MNAYKKVYNALQTVMVSMPGGLGRFPELYDVVSEALKTKPRNCDVGTAEEQAERFLTFCTNHQTFDGCSECPLYGSDRCEIAWTQMPYEEGGNNESK